MLDANERIYGARLTPADASDGVIKLSLGKKRHVLLKPV